MRTAILLFALCCSTMAWAVKPVGLAARRDYSARGYVAVADVNGDGIPDVVVDNYGSITTLFGKGEGSLRVGPSFVPTGLFYGGYIAAGDLNDDGYADLIITGSDGGPSTGGVFVCLGNGDGTFASVFYQTGSDQAGVPVIGDFNGDGIVDIVTVGSQGVWLFTGRGAGLFSPGVLTPAPVPGIDYNGGLLAADFNGDGNLDLVYLFNGFNVVFGNGDGTFRAPVNYPASGGFMAIADVNRDGHVDIATGGGCCGDPNVYVYLNNGEGVFFLAGQATMTGYSFAIGDVNGDGIPDIVDAAGCLALGEGHVKFSADFCYPIPVAETSFNVVLADLRKSGSLDIVAGENFVTSVLLNNGKGEFMDGLWVPLDGAAACGAAADYNGDGKPDLAVPTPSGITILLGTGKARAPYVMGPTIAVAGGTGCPVSGDLNNDGIPDLLFGSNSSGGLVAYLGKGDGTFTPAGTVAINSSSFVLSDFNNDGRVDIAASSNQLAYGRGNGEFEAPLALVANPPSSGFDSIANGDVNNDGWMDLVLPANIANQTYVLLNNQLGGFTINTIPGYFHLYGYGPDVVALADLNRDGNLDAVVDYGARSVGVYLGDGLGGFKLSGQPLLSYIGSYPHPPSVGDVNGDGIPDILMPSSGSLGIALGIGDGLFLDQRYVGTGNGAVEIILSNVHGQPARLPDIVAPDGNGGVEILINTTLK